MSSEKDVKGFITKLIYGGATVFCSVSIIVFGIVFLSQAGPVTTIIGENIGTNDLAVAGKLEVAGQATLDGPVGVGVAAPSAYLHLKAGTATAGTAPLKLTSGTNLTTAEAGAMEYDGTNLYFTPAAARKTVAFTDSNITGTASNVTGTVAVANGGTGAGTFTSGGILYGNGTSALGVTAAGTNNYLLYSNSGTPAWTNAPTISGANITALNAGNISSGTLAVGRGGTGATSLTGVLKGNGTGAITAMTGTANYAVRWTDANTLGTGTLYDDGTNVGIGTTGPTDLLTLKTIAADERASLGGELTDASNWTTTGWTGTYAGGFTHTAGNVSALSRTMTNAIGDQYLVLFTISGLTAGGVTVGLGGDVTKTYYANDSYTYGMRAVATDGPLVITPTSDFNGTVSAISVKLISSYGSTQTVVDSAGMTVFQMRASANDLYDLFIGKGSGQFNYSGRYNTTVGIDTMSYNTTGFFNSAFGLEALHSNTAGNYNTAFGVEAMYHNVSGEYNTAVGYYSLGSNTNGEDNAALGMNSLRANTTGNYNTAVGVRALDANTGGSSNTAMGNRALAKNVSGNHLSAFGYEALYNSTGESDTAVGYFAGYDVTSGASNTLIGRNTGRGITTGSYNTILGAEVTGLAAGLSNTVILADGQGNQRLFIDSGGHTGIGTSTPSAQLTLRTASVDEASTLGTEQCDANGWTAADWTGNYAAGFVHTAGFTTALSRAMANTTGDPYLVTFTLTGVSAGSVQVGLGGSAPSARNFIADGSYSYGARIVADNGPLVFTPSSDFNGTISGISVRRLYAYDPTINLVDSNANSAYELRAGSYSQHNLFVGRNAGRYQYSGTYNTAVGGNALAFNSTGSNNAAFGHEALYNNDAGSYNTALGYEALFSNLSGQYNTGVGFSALGSNTVGVDNVAVGMNALRLNTTGSSNTALGVRALDKDTTGYENTALGNRALANTDTGSDDTALGHYAGYDLTSGSGNTFVGRNTGRGLTTGSNNTILGAAVTGLAAGLSNTVILADGAGNQRFYIDSNGNAGIGTTSPASRLTLGVASPTEASLKTTNASSALTVYVPYADGAVIPLVTGTSNANYTPMAAIWSYVTGSGTYLRFGTSSTYATGITNTAMSIDYDGDVAIGADVPAASAALEVASTTKGFLPPRMTTAQRDAISSPTAGLVIYNTSTNKLNFYNGAGWETVTSAL